MRETSALEGGMRRFMGDSAVWLDEAEDELLILEEDLTAEYSNSGGPAENDLRLQNVAVALEKLHSGCDHYQLETLSEVAEKILRLTRAVLREGDLDFNLERLTALLLGIDVLRDMLEGVETKGIASEADPTSMDTIERALEE